MIQMLRFKCHKCLQSLCKICKMDKPITINLIMIYSHPSSRKQVTLSWATVIYLSKLHQAFNWLILNLWWAVNFKNFVKWIKIAQMEMRRPWYRVRMTFLTFHPFPLLYLLLLCLTSLPLGSTHSQPARLASWHPRTRTQAHRSPGRPPSPKSR